MPSCADADASYAAKIIDFLPSLEMLMDAFLCRSLMPIDYLAAGDFLPSRFSRGCRGLRCRFRWLLSSIMPCRADCFISRKISGPGAVIPGLLAAD